MCLHCCMQNTATGFLPYMLLFRWKPRDLRAPLGAIQSPGDVDTDAWLSQPARTLKQANVSLADARAAMIRAHKMSGKQHQHSTGDLVKVSTRVLPLRVTSTQTQKVLPKFIDPFPVLSVVLPKLSS